MKTISNAGILRKYAATRYLTHLQNMPVSAGSSGKNGIIFMGPPRGFGDLGRRAIYFQGAGEHC